MTGLREGCRQPEKNMRSAEENSQVVDEYLEAEMRRGVLLGPFSPELVPEVHINRFGVIPKSNRPGKWRLIVNLSHLDRRSVNNGVDPEMCSLTDVRMDDVMETLLDLCPGVELAKLDVKSAYRIVPVHPEGRHLLGMRWRGQM